MEGQSGLSELSVISWVSTIQGCPLSVVPLYTILSLGFFPDCFEECSSFLRHKMTMISPSILKQYSIPFNKVSAFAPSLVEGLIIV